MSPFGGMDFSGGMAANRLGGNPWLDGGMNPMGAMMNQTLMLQETQLMQWLVGMLRL